MKTYDTNDTWKAINKMLPDDIGISDDINPIESFFSWRKSCIYTERFVNSASKVKVIMHHGVGTNARLLSVSTGAALARQGLEVIAVDMPLYGMTQNNEGLITYQDWIDVSLEVIDRESKADDRPIVLYGLSAGGMLCYDVASQEPRVRGVVGMCFLNLQDIRVKAIISPFPFAALVESIGAMTFKLLAQTPLRILPVPMRWVSKMSALSNNKEAQAILIKDKLSAGSSVPISFIGSVFSYKPKLQPEQFLSCPVLLTQPDEDRWTPLSASSDFFDRLACPKQIVMLEDAGHYPMEAKGLRQMRDAIVQFCEKIVD
jgi:alpha-beta hydrolase superfamily lysophospholipase